jgi:diguanylate cyclase (GGDEF)-like protein
VLVDIDHFQAYNDAYGHPAGDRALQLVARALLQQARRAGELVARVGGEEFAILLSGAELAGAEALAARVREALVEAAVPHAASPTASILTASLGVAALVPRKEIALGELFAAADAALYRAKTEGRDRVVAALAG